MIDFKIKNQSNQNFVLILAIVFIVIYLVSATVLLLKIRIPTSLIIHFINSLIGMAGLLVINYKYSTAFLRYLTLVAAFYYILSSFAGILFSINRNNLEAFNNMGALTNTDGFLVVVVVGYLLFITKKEHK